MKANDNFRVQQKCSGCEFRHQGYFCDFSAETLTDFEGLKSTRIYPIGKIIFTQGQPSNGVFVLCQGRAKLSMYSQDGKTVILRVAEPGDVMGLSATISNRRDHTTAEAVENCQVNYIEKSKFKKFLKRHPEAAQSAMGQLNKNYERACGQIRSLALSGSRAERLARLFLSWIRRNGNGHTTCQLKLGFTHEEIGAMIGASRETVTRLMKEFKQRGLIEVKGKILTICDAARLEVMTDERSKGPEFES